MHQYLLSEENRDAIGAHNDTMVVTTTRVVGRSSYTSYDFNREEETRQLNTILAAPDVATQTVRTIATAMYGCDDDDLVRRVRASLRYGSPYQKTLRNGSAFIARKDGTLRITGSPEEYGDLVEEQLAEGVTKVTNYVRTSTKRMDRELAGAVDKVPELAERMAGTREEAKASLGSLFSRQLELLSGVD